MGWLERSIGQRMRQDTLALFLPGVPPEDLPTLSERLGEELTPPVEPEAEAVEEPKDLAAAVEAALDSSQAGALSRVVKAAPHGALDEALLQRILEEARPARTLGGLLFGVLAPGGPAADRIGALTARHLGADPVRWRGLHDALARHRGTLPELLAAEPAPPTDRAKAPPTSVPTTLCMLLEHSAPEHIAAALLRLPDWTIEQMLAGGSLPGARLQSAVADRGDRRSRIALARHPRIDARMLKRLVAADDPQVNAAVYRNARCTRSLRRTVVRRMDTVPLAPELRAQLLSYDCLQNSKLTWLTPLLGSGDPELTAQALRVGAGRRIAHLHALVRVWERSGEDAVRGILADEAMRPYLAGTVVTQLRAALAEPDGLARLRAKLEPYDDPAVLPRLLSSSRGTSTLRDLFNEPYAHDFPALAAANRKRPFMPMAAEELIRHEDATDADRAEFRLSVLNEPWRAGGERGGNLTPPTERLAKETLDYSADDWAVGMVRGGLLDPMDLLVLARPAPRVVEALTALAKNDLLTPASEAAIRDTAREHLVGNPEAWAVLLQLLPDFTGTLVELVTVSARISGPGSAAEAPEVAVTPAPAPPLVGAARDAVSAGPPPAVKPAP